MFNASDVVIWSADVDRRTLDEVLIKGLPLCYVKLDRLGLTRMGLDLIEAVQGRGFRVFADAKIAEIPDKVVEIARLHLDYGPWMLNVMAHICSTGEMEAEDPKKVDALKRFADLCHARGTRPCAVTVLTSKTEQMVANEFNDRTSIGQVLEYVEMLLQAGFTDVVCSPLEVAAIRAESRFDGLALNTPGVRLPGSATQDQARVDTPVTALLNGANRVVIGRDLTNGDFAANWQRIVNHLEGTE
jgi:orotidine-5'-phosphate decarboxylase